MVREVPIEILKMAGLWRVFNDVEEFKAAVFRCGGNFKWSR
jgi:hypothetical protein